VPAEAILATGLFYYDIENIIDSHLEFQQALHDVNPMEYHQDDPCTWKEFGLMPRDHLNQYAGHIPVRSGRCVVFPNVLQHRPSGFQLSDPLFHQVAKGHRKILVFFLINPDTPIVSTQHVPIQQLEIKTRHLQSVFQGIRAIPAVAIHLVAECLTLPHDQAIQNRARLMDIRSHVADASGEYFEETVSLCEH